MSHVATAHSGPYTLTIEDKTGSAPDLGTVRMSGIQPSWGRLQRTSESGIYPCQFTVTAEDPTGDLADLFSGGFTEKDYIVELTGPSGPNGNSFKMELLPKEYTSTDPLSPKVHPDKAAITFYDGLTRNRSSDGTYERANSGLAPSIRTLLQEVFTRANQRLYVWCRVPVGHTTLNWFGDYGPETLTEIHFPTRSESDWSSWWDPLQELCTRYDVAVFQDPYDHDSTNGRPRWKVIPATEIGLAVQGRTTGGTAFIGSEQVDTLTADSIKVQESSGQLAVRDGQEYEDAVVFRVKENLLSDSDQDRFDATVVNGQNALRDPNYNFENSNNNRPFYGESQRVSILDNPRRLELDPDAGTSTDSYWRSEPFYVGEQLAYGELKYTFELSGGLNVSGAEVRIKILNEDGTLSTTFSDTQTGAPLTMRFEASGKMVQVEVYVPHDSNATPVFEYTQEYLRFWWTSSGRPLGADSDVESLLHSAENSGILRQSLSGLADMVLDGVPITGTGDLAPTSVYQDAVTNTDSYTAGQLAKRLRLMTRPPGTQTLRSTLRDEVLGPNTRIEVEDSSGTVQRRLVMCGGRKTHLRKGYTELADIETPISSP